MTDILSLSNWTVLSVEYGDELIIKAEFLVQPEECIHCNSEEIYKHGPKTISYRDAPVRGKPVVIQAVLRRYRCRECGITFVQPIGGIEYETRMTQRCADMIRDEIFNDTFVNTARRIGCDEKTIRTIANKYVAELNEAYKPDLSGWIGIDETMIDGKQRFVVVNVEQRRYIDMFDTRDKAAVSNWLQRNRNAPIEGFVMDMWKPYKDAIRAVFPNTPIIVDKFHVVRIANQAMDGVRIQLSKDRTKAIGKDWMRRKSLLRMRYKNLDEHGLYNTDMWLANEPHVAIAHNLKELFYCIYDQNNRADAEQVLDDWLDIIPSEMKKTAKDFKPLVTAVKNWREEILAYFDKPLTNGYTEAMNGVAKVINRQGRGYSFEMLRAKLLFKDNHRQIYKNRPSPFLSVEEILKVMEQSHVCQICSAKPIGEVSGLGLGYCNSCFDKLLNEEVNSTQS